MSTLAETLKLQDQAIVSHLELHEDHHVHSDVDSASTASCSKHDIDTDGEEACKTTTNGIKRMHSEIDGAECMNREDSLQDANLPGIRMNSRLQQRPEKYTLVSNQLRYDLIQSVVYGKIKIKNAAKQLNINYSTAKSIVQKFKREGRVIKKTIKPEGEEQENEGCAKMACDKTAAAIIDAAGNDDKELFATSHSAVVAAQAQAHRFTPMVRGYASTVPTAASTAALMQLNYLRMLNNAAVARSNAATAAAVAAGLFAVSEKSAFNQVSNASTAGLQNLNGLTAATLAASQKMSSQKTTASAGTKPQYFTPLVTIQRQ